MVHRANFVYTKSEYTYSFKKFWLVNTFGRDIYNDAVTLQEPHKDQISL